MVMNVARYSEAFASAIQVEVDPSFIPRLPLWRAWPSSSSSPGRPGCGDPRDAADFATLLRVRCRGQRRPSVRRRVWGSGGCGYDFDLAGAWLLGIDAGPSRRPWHTSRFLLCLAYTRRMRL